MWRKEVKCKRVRKNLGTLFGGEDGKMSLEWVPVNTINTKVKVTDDKEPGVKKGTLSSSICWTRRQERNFSKKWTEVPYQI